MCVCVRGPTVLALVVQLIFGLHLMVELLLQLIQLFLKLLTQMRKEVLLSMVIIFYSMSLNNMKTPTSFLLSELDSLSSEFSLQSSISSAEWLLFPFSSLRVRRQSGAVRVCDRVYLR